VLAENMLHSDVWMACNMLHDIEREQVRRFSQRQYLTRLEREIRDALLDLLEPDFPLVVNEYRELNRTLDANIADVAARPDFSLCPT
jgi:hypothetical protein